MLNLLEQMWMFLLSLSYLKPSLPSVCFVVFFFNLIASCYGSVPHLFPNIHSIKPADSLHEFLFEGTTLVQTETQGILETVLKKLRLTDHKHYFLGWLSMNSHDFCPNTLLSARKVKHQDLVWPSLKTSCHLTLAMTHWALAGSQIISLKEQRSKNHGLPTP